MSRRVELGANPLLTCLGLGYMPNCFLFPLNPFFFAGRVMSERMVSMDGYPKKESISWITSWVTFILSVSGNSSSVSNLPGNTSVTTTGHLPGCFFKISVSWIKAPSSARLASIQPFSKQRQTKKNQTMQEAPFLPLKRNILRNRETRYLIQKIRR